MTSTEKAIKTSLLIVRIVSQIGIWTASGIDFNVRVINAVDNNNLSAIGSRKDPKTVFCWSFLARRPSSPSVRPAQTNNKVASFGCP